MLTGVLIITLWQAKQQLAGALGIKSVKLASMFVDGRNDDWQANTIEPLEDLNWVNAHSMPMDKEQRRIKSVSIAHDGKSLFVLLDVDPGVKEDFEKKQASGHIGYIYLDCDGKETTGARRHIRDEYPGWDYRIYISTGFSTAVGSSQVEPLVAYDIERIKKFNMRKVRDGYTFDCEYGDVAGGSKISLQHPTHIGFEDKFVELRFPFELVQINPPTKIRLVIEDLRALPNAETQFFGFLNRST